MGTARRKLLLLYRFDWVLFSLIIVLTSIGLASIYSVDLSRGETLNYFPTQSLALVLGVAGLFIASQLHISIYRSATWLGYAVALLMLISVLIFGQTIRGTTGWFNIGGLSFQPAEFAKLAYILFLANWMDLYHRRFDTWQFVVSSGLFMLAFVGLIMMQPDLGSAAIIGGIWFGMLLVSRTKKRYIAIIVGSGLVTLLIGWFFLFAPYQKDRLLNFVHPERDPLGTGYNVTQSIIAVGSGKLWGRGLGFGSQSQLHFLPEAQTDFIFSVIGEELGFIGVLVVLTLYFMILWRLMLIASRANDDFTAYLVIGVALLFFIQVLVNMGAALGLLPVTGVTLPFLSYGGSSLLMNLLLIGVVESVVVSNT